MANTLDNSSSNVTTTTNPDVPPSDIIMNIIVLITIGSIGMVANVFILIVIKRNKELQSPCFLLIAGECLCSTMMALGHFGNGIDELLQFTGLLPSTRQRAWCFLTKSLVIAMCIEASSLVTMCISVDRLISILYPIKYRQLGKRYAYSCVAFCFGFATIASFAGIFGDGTPETDLSAMITCEIFFHPLTPGYLKFYGSFNFSFSVVCTLMYGVMLVTFEVKRRKFHRSADDVSDSVSNAFMKQQIACMPMIRLLMAYYIVISGGPEIGIPIMSESEIFRPYLNRFYYYGSSIKALTSLAEIVALGFGSRQFRKCVREMWCDNGTAKWAAPSGTVQMDMRRMTLRGQM